MILEPPPPWVPPSNAPIPLHTKRLVVDWYRDEDAATLFATIEAHRATLATWLAWANRDHRTEDESLGRIRALARERGFAHPEDLTLGIFARGDRELWGGTGLHGIDRTTATAEVGYWVRPDRQGRGIATEAVGALVTSAVTDWGLRRVIIACDGANPPSQRVAEKLGFRLEAREVRSHWRTDFGWSDEVRYAVLATEWDTGRHRGPAA